MLINTLYYNSILHLFYKMIAPFAPIPAKYRKIGSFKWGDKRGNNTNRGSPTFNKAWL